MSTTPPITDRDIAPPLECTVLPPVPALPTVPSLHHGAHPDWRETASTARKTDPQTPTSKSSAQWRLDLRSASDDLARAAAECLPPRDSGYEGET